LYTGQILYILSMGLSRCSTTLFLHNLAQSKKHTVASIVLVALSVAWTIGSCFSIALRGNLSAPWETVEAPVRHFRA
jgi:Na+-driven multidrug efflux pump